MPKEEGKDKRRERKQKLRVLFRIPLGLHYLWPIGRK